MKNLSRRQFLALGAAAGLGSLPVFARRDEFVVHEWGVVTIPDGSDEVTLRGGGVEEDLPEFVHTWKKAFGFYVERWKNRPIRKPVVYFYTDKKMDVSVRVQVPQGRPDAWWPAANDFAPKPQLNWGRGGLKRQGDQEEEIPRPEDVEPKNGALYWNRLTLDPSAKDFPAAEGWWKIARDTDATPVTQNLERDKFLFYDALARFEQPVEVEWKDDVVLKNRGEALPFAYAVRVRKGKCSFGRLGALREETELRLKPGTPDTLAKDLRGLGLYPKEAAGMVKIWTKELFETDGVRVIVPVPDAAYRKLLPLQIRPEPDRLVRVCLAHIECLDDERRKQVGEWIDRLGDPDLAVRSEAYGQLRELGPLADKQVREALKSTDDPEVRSRLQSLLK